LQLTADLPPGWQARPPRKIPPTYHLQADRAAEIIAARLDGLRANMSATPRALKAAAESSRATPAAMMARCDSGRL
jgi:hypothetical protein